MNFNLYSELSFLFLVVSFSLISCNPDDTEISFASKYPDKIIGNWEHVSSQHRYLEEDDNTGFFTVYHDSPIFALELHEDESFTFSRFNQDCIHGSKFEYVEDEFGYSSINFFFDCEIEWQGELVSTINAAIVGYDTMDVLILSYRNSIESCQEFCTTAFQRID